MQGKRHDFGKIINLEMGEYGKDADGNWWARVPAPGYSTGILSDHQVTEHNDGTITVSPSILMEGHGDRPAWHGYLERGVWRKA